MLKTSSRVVMSTKVCNGAEHMALESSARVAVTNAIENKDDLGQMLGKATTTLYAHVLQPAFDTWCRFHACACDPYQECDMLDHPYVA